VCAVDAGANAGAEEPMSTFSVAGGAKADGAEGAGGHAIVMGLMGLDVGANGEASVAFKIDVATGDDGAGCVAGGEAGSSGEGIEPENRLLNEVSDDETGDIAER